jgi:hypothetical protein
MNIHIEHPTAANFLLALIVVATGRPRDAYMRDRGWLYWIIIIDGNDRQWLLSLTVIIRVFTL